LIQVKADCPSASYKIAYRAVLRDAAQTLYSALQAGDEGSGDETSGLTAKEEVQLLHIME
jgi:hypothetical protein